MEYADILFKKQKLENNELLDSIRLKAIESYITLEKKILPICNTYYENHPNIVFCVIIDDYIESMEDTLSELAGDSSDNNTIANIRSSLSRLINLVDTSGEQFFYDEIKVFSPYEFKIYLDQNIVA